MKLKFSSSIYTWELTKENQEHVHNINMGQGRRNQGHQPPQGQGTHKGIYIHGYIIRGHV